MEWSPESKIKYLVGLNWTVTTEKDPDEGYTILRVRELPSVIATGGDDIPALEKDFWESLQATLESALQFGDSIQLPKGARLPWEHAPPTPLRNVVVEGGVEVRAYVPQPKQTSSPVPLRELAVA